MKYKKLLMICSIFYLLSCTKDEISFYEGQDGISFFIDQYAADSLDYSFAFALEEKEKDTLWLDMRVMGYAADYDRPIHLVPTAQSTARQGVDYVLPDVVLPAGELYVRFPVVIFNTPEMKTRSFKIVLRVNESDDFISGAEGLELGGSKSLNTMKMTVSNQYLEPVYWVDVMSDFGAFSETRYRFMVEATGFTIFSFEALGYNRFFNLPVALRNALDEYVAVHGPLIDEYGQEVTF